MSEIEDDGRDAVDQDVLLPPSCLIKSALVNGVWYHTPDLRPCEACGLPIGEDDATTDPLERRWVCEWCWRAER